MQVKTKIIDHYGRFGRCLSISNGQIEAYVTLDRGPRIIYLGACGGPNLFFTDDEDKLVQKGPPMDQVFGENAEFHFMGGHRLWLAPQHPIKTCMPDNKPVSYVIIENGAIFTPPVQNEIGVQNTMAVTMDQDKPNIRIECTVLNISSEPRQFAVWQLAQLAKNGLEIIPQIPAPFDRGNWDRIIEPDRHMAIWAMTDMADERFAMTSRYFTLRQDPDMKRPFKIGLNNSAGWAMYANLGYVLLMHHDLNEGGTYTDDGSNFETYTDANFLEMEALGEYKKVRPGQELSHAMTFAVLSAKMDPPDARDAEAIDAFVQAHLE